MNNTVFKRFLTFILALICVVSIISPAVPEAQAASSDTLVTDGVVQERIKELEKRLGGTYFNTTHNRQTCGAKSGGHGCAECSNANVVKSKWFGTEFGFKLERIGNKFPTHNGFKHDENGILIKDEDGKPVKSRLEPSAKSCAGFAAFAEWYIFRTSNTAKVETVRVGDFKSTKENWAKCKPGDMIRWKTHSFIYISSDAKNEKVKVLDCNWPGTDRDGKTANNCMVQVHNIKMSTYSERFVVTREKTRVNCKHDKGYQTDWTSDGNYRDTVCKKCGTPFKYTVDTSFAGTATTGKEPIVYAEPYGDAAEIYCFVSGKSVKLLGKIINAYGNEWYKISFAESGKEKTGYIFCKQLKNFVCEQPENFVCKQPENFVCTK